MFFHDGFVYSLKSWHFLFAPRKILVAHLGLGPWAVRNGPASRAGRTTKHTGFIGISPTRIREIWWEYGICMFFYSKMALLSIQTTVMQFQWIHSMGRCERGHGGHKKASGVPNIWRRLEHCMDPQSLYTYVIVSLRAFIMHIQCIKTYQWKVVYMNIENIIYICYKL